jgi:sugar phosphate isomerase/epimerase
MFKLGYNTNGLAHHRLSDALPLLAELGYEAVALTPDVGQLDPFTSSAEERRAVRALAQDLGLSLVIETGARFLLDPRRKHFPTLLEEQAADRARRIQFLLRCADLAVELGAPVVSIWSGASPSGVTAEDEGPDSERAWELLVEGVAEVSQGLRERGLTLGFEPEPGMFVERPAGFLELRERLGSTAEALGLTLDVGHLLCTGDTPVPEAIAALGPYLVNVHLDDIRAGVHEHLMFGQGDLDLEGTLSALLEVGYDGVASVELSRDSHRGASAAQEAIVRVSKALVKGA